MTEDQIFKHIDIAVDNIEIVKSILVLKRLKPNALNSFDADFYLEHGLDCALRELTISQTDRIPF